MSEKALLIKPASHPQRIVTEVVLNMRRQCWVRYRIVGLFVSGSEMNFYVPL